MSGFSRLRPDAAGALTWARKVVYGAGYLRARRAAFQRSGGMCQLCGLFRAEEAHHWAWRYPADKKITADDLTALCRRCHWAATLLRLTGRIRAGVWFILGDGDAVCPPPQTRYPTSSAPLLRYGAVEGVTPGDPRPGTGSERADHSVSPGAGRGVPGLREIRPARRRPVPPPVLAVDVRDTAAPPPVLLLLPLPEPKRVGAAGRLAAGPDRPLGGASPSQRRGAGGRRP